MNSDHAFSREGRDADDRPMLEFEGWTEGLSLEHFVSETHFPAEETSS